MLSTKSTFFRFVVLGGRGCGCCGGSCGCVAAYIVAQPAHVQSENYKLQGGLCQFGDCRSQKRKQKRWKNDRNGRTRTSQKDWQLLKMKRGNYVLVWLPVAFEACFTAMFNRGFHLHTYFGHWVCGCLLRGGPCLLCLVEGNDTLFS